MNDSKLYNFEVTWIDDFEEHYYRTANFSKAVEVVKNHLDDGKTWINHILVYSSSKKVAVSRVTPVAADKWLYEDLKTGTRRVVEEVILEEELKIGVIKWTTT